MTKNRIKRESFLHKYQRLSKVFNNSINIIRSKYSSPPESSPQVNRSLIIKNSMQRNTYPQFLPTQRAAPCDLSQAAGIPVASAPCTQLQQPQVYLPGSRQGASQGDLLIQNNNNVQSFQPDAVFQQNRDAQTYVPGTVSTQIQHHMPLLSNVHPEERSTQGPHSEIYLLNAYARPFMPNHCNTFPPLQSNHQLIQMTTSYPQHNGSSVVYQPHIPCNTTRNQLQPMNKNAQF